MIDDRTKEALMRLGDTLIARAGDYGAFSENARITQTMVAVFAAQRGYNELDCPSREALHMITHKLARIVSGAMTMSDDAVEDTLLDIAGYALLWNSYRAKEDADA